jgi:hypothetical protein
LIYEEDYAGIDDKACTECLVTNDFYERHGSVFPTCDDATALICESFETCRSVCCYPKLNVCQEEVHDYYICIFGIVVAPENCVVPCEGSIPADNGGSNNGDDSIIEGDNGSNNGSGSNNGGKSNNGDVNSDATSDGSAAHAAVTFPGFILAILAGLLL